LERTYSAIKNPTSRNFLRALAVLRKVFPVSSSTTKWAKFSTNHKPATTKNTILAFVCLLATAGPAALGPTAKGPARQKKKAIGTLDVAFFALNNQQMVHLENGNCLENVEGIFFEIGTDGAAIGPAAVGSATVGPAIVGPAAVGSKNFPFNQEIIKKILSYLNSFDLAKCAQASKQLMDICEDKEFQQYRELKKMFKNSTLKLTANDFIMVNITHQEAVNGIKEALKQKTKLNFYWNENENLKMGQVY
jgi:hypothetical protein